VFGWLKRKLFGTNTSDRVAELRRRLHQIRARYDAAQQTDDLRRYWANADNLSPVQANSADVRARLRNRVRYLRDNNEHADGLVSTYADHVIGTGPTLQVLTDNKEANDRIEAAWWEWMEATGFAEKLRLMCEAKVSDGEAVGVIKSNEGLETAVQLDLELIEADQLATPTGVSGSFDVPDGFTWVDGIVFDTDGNPVEYHVLPEHPGGGSSTFFAPLPTGEYRRIAARYVVHWFKQRRPGQRRGVPEIVASMEALAHLHRFSKATILAAEKAAMLSVLLKTDLPPDGNFNPPEEWEEMELALDMMMTLPAGAEPYQMKAEHPAQSHSEFVRRKLTDIGRPLGVPYIVHAGDSSMSNYSSARLDMLLFKQPVNCVRESCRRRVLERMFGAWLNEAVMVPGLLPSLSAIDRLPHRWNWPSIGYVDPLKEAQADSERIKNGTATRTGILAANGEDYEEILQTKAREAELEAEYGVTPEPAAPTPAEPDQADTPDQMGAANGAQA
jgi:lambda family phage portal protein